MRQSNTNSETQCVKISNELLMEFSDVTNKLIDKFSCDSFEKSIHNAITGWIISNDIENTESKERLELTFLLFNCVTHFRFCEPSRHLNHQYPTESYQFIINLGFKKRKKYFKEVKKGFLESCLADENILRSDTMYHLETIEEYIKKIQLLYSQS